MKSTTQKFIKELENKEIVYEILSEENDGNDVVKVLIVGSNAKEITILISFEEGNTAMLVGCGIKVPENKKFSFLQKINELNCKYKWAKFELLDGNDLVLGREDKLYENNAGDIVLSSMANLFAIADDTYPEFMKIMWS